MKKTRLDVGMRLLAAFVVCAVLPSLAPAQTYTVLHNFEENIDGFRPDGPLVQGFDGEMYGTTSLGSISNGGTLYKIASNGSLTIVHHFADHIPNDISPAHTLLESQYGTFYGTTTTVHGLLYRLNPSGAETAIRFFCRLPGCADGTYPTSMIWDWNQDLRLTMLEGGINNNGTILRQAPEGDGTETVIHTFCQLPNCSDGSLPLAMIQAGDGNFYGVAEGGGRSTASGGQAGIVFSMGPNRPFTIVYEFCSEANCADGANPTSLIEGTDGNLYGTTLVGGTIGAGTIFKMTTSGVLTTLYSFCSLANCADGDFPSSSSVVMGSDGSLYGFTSQGGDSAGDGTVFKLSASGTFTVLHTFDGADGRVATAFTQSTDGTFYGATLQGGSQGAGVVFRLEDGLPPFIQPVLTFGRVGAAVALLGTNLAGATAVRFNGTAATIGNVTSTRIETTVPVGATSGRITVTTPAATLTSNGSFTVLP